MRVSKANIISRFNFNYDDDRGAVIVITAVLMVALLGMTAMVFDLGMKRAERRELAAATDAGALAAAGAYAMGEDGCAIAADYVLGTDPEAALLGDWCTHAGFDSYGVVSVKAEQTIDYAFAPVLGVDEGTTRSLTRAAYSVPASVHGDLRPFALCVDTLERLAVLPLDDFVRAVITYGKDDHPEDCNGDQDLPGNWAMIDFDGGGNDREDQQIWTRDGYPGSVSSGVPGRLCSDPGEEQHCRDGDPGAWSNTLAPMLDHLIENEIWFTVPLFDSGGANGNNAYFHIVGFAIAKLHAYDGTGPAQTRWLDIEFRPGVVQGTIEGSNSLDTGTRVITICGVEAVNSC